MALALLLFSVVIGGFLGYHLWMVSRGTTTYEGFKAQEAQRTAQLEAKTLNLGPGRAGSLGDPHPGPSGDQEGMRPGGAGQSQGPPGPTRRRTTKHVDAGGGMLGDGSKEVWQQEPGEEVMREQVREGVTEGPLDAHRRASAGVPNARRHDRGFARNFAEVLFPNTMLAKARKRG